MNQIKEIFMSTTDDNKKVKNTGKEKTFYLGKLGLNWADEADFVYYDVYDEAEKKELVDALTKIGNNEVPLADMPFETDDNISWWWLLVIALFGAAGKAMYENHKRKEEA